MKRPIHDVQGRLCGCCEGIEKLTPQATANRPGLDALAYRVGTHATFLETMKARLSSGEYPALTGLTTREADDPAIAMLDAWATVADVLTFYQERIANEGYLLTATERRSILELARLVGYKLRSGVAASVYLAFSLEKGHEVEIPAGTRAQSLPGPGELPQAFETSEPLVARAEWNELEPRMTRPQDITLVNEEYINTDTVYLEGIATNLKPNAPLLLVFDPKQCQAAFHKVESVEVDAAANRTKVTLQGVSPAARVEKLKRVVERYLELDSFGVSPTTQMAGRVSGILQRVTGALKPDVEPGKAAAMLDEVLPELRKEHTLAVEGGFSKLEPWVREMVAELEAHRSELAQSRPATSPAVKADSVGTPHLAGGPPLAGLAGLVTPLLKDPSLQPASALRLARDIKTTFAAKSDAVPRLLTTMQPRLREPLYKAWANLPATPPSPLPLQRIEALRVEAAPFGHNAPLKPIYDDEGKIIGQEEWPLTDPVTTSVALVLPSMQWQAWARVFSSVSNPSHMVSQVTARPFLYVAIEEEGTALNQMIPLFTLGLGPLEQDVIVGSHPVTVALGPVVRFGRTFSEPAKVDVWVDGNKIDVIWPDDQPPGTIFSAITNAFPRGVYRFQFGPEGENSDPGWDATLLIEPGRINTIVAVGEEPGQRKLVYLRDDLALPPADKVRLRVVHLASNFPKPIDVKLVYEDESELFLCQELKYAEHRDETHFRDMPLKSGTKLQVVSETTTVYEMEMNKLGLEAGKSYDLHIHSIVQEGPGQSAVIAVPSHYLPGGFSDLALYVVFEDLGRTFRLHLDGLASEDPTMTAQIIPDYEGKNWILKPGQKVQESAEHRTVIIHFGQNPLILYRARVPLPQIQRATVILDAVYDQITPGSCIVVERPKPGEPEQIEQRILKVEKARPVSQAAYGISGKATELVLDGDWLDEDDTDLSVLRRTTIYAQGEELALAEEPIEKDVARDSIVLDGLYDGFESGRWLIVSGERTDVIYNDGNVIPGVPGAELVMLASVEQSADETLPGDTPHTTLVLANDLSYTYKRDTVTIHGNVAHATHGETRQEVLGSGDGSQIFQPFTLKQSPLTYLAAPTPAGAETTLEVRVNDVLWHEADNLFVLGSNDRAYITRTDDDDKTSITFGDGRHGARLSTGVENVKAVYRTGIGKPGNVAAERISLLATRPLGVKGVINPLPATGGANREGRDQARRNAPLAVMALDRLVSVQDYADFARAYAGIGKASAARLPDGRRQLIHVTIAGADDIPIAETSDLYRNLCQALHQCGDPYQPIQVDVRELMLLVISARVRVLPDHQWESVEPKVRKALLEAFGFERRDLGQDVPRSEVFSVIQSVPGVAYVDLDVLDAVDEQRLKDFLAEQGESENVEEIVKHLDLELSPRINVSMADLDDDGIRPAQLAILSPDVPDTLILTELTL